MEPEKTIKNVPRQQSGTHTDTSHAVKLKSSEKAVKQFEIAKNRLLDVSNWHRLCDGVSATFQLTDSNGNEVKGLAQKGYFFRINIPAPGTNAGDGYDWVHIESIEEQHNEVWDEEWISMRVRPAKNPAHLKEGTAHFFKEDATSNFVVKRSGNIVTAAVHGRNEKPNTDNASIGDKIRNVFVALGAMLGFSKTQWKSLVKGLVEVK
jgi:hypothetical protein